MELAVNLRNEDLHWFIGKTSFTDGGVYMSFNGGIGSRVILLCSCGLAFPYGHEMLVLVSGVSKDCGDKELVRFMVPRQLLQQQKQPRQQQKYIYIYIYIYIHIHTYKIYTYMYTYTHTKYIHTYIHIYIYIYIHIYTYMRT